MTPAFGMQSSLTSVDKENSSIATKDQLQLVSKKRGPATRLAQLSTFTSPPPRLNNKVLLKTEKSVAEDDHDEYQTINTTVPFKERQSMSCRVAKEWSGVAKLELP